jgi:ribosomal protein S18 acetylase RimI-like enzyme
LSDANLDELAEAARNRGLKLVRSRVRTPNKRRFGKVGLTDRNGRPIFGMDDRGPAATPEEVENYLRNLGARDWGASLDVAVLPRKRMPTKMVREAANDAGEDRADLRARPGRRVQAKGAEEREPRTRAKPQGEPKPAAKPKPVSRPAPEPRIREARAADAPRLVELIRYLGHEIDEKSLRRNLRALKKSGETPLVATLEKRIVGMCGLGRRIVVHRLAPLGRITMLVVASEAQGRGIGRMLVEAAEKWMQASGCRLVEVTSNDRRTAAHAFYRHLGYERTSIRFSKEL